MKAGISILTLVSVVVSIVTAQSDFYDNDNFGDFYSDIYDNDNNGIYGFGMMPSYWRGYGMFGNGFGRYGRGYGMYGRGMYGGFGDMYGRGFGGNYYGNRWGYPRMTMYRPRRRSWYMPRVYMGY